MDGVCCQPPSASSGDRSLIVDNMNSFLDGEHLITQAQISNRTKTLLAQLNEDVFFSALPSSTSSKDIENRDANSAGSVLPVRDLEPQIDITNIHNKFNKDDPNSTWSYKLFRQAFYGIHISFACLGKTSAPHAISWVEQKKKEYEQEARRRSFEKDATRLVYTADLQSVSMLPHMEMFREAAFTRILVALNHLYAPLQQRLCMQTSGIWPQEMATPMIVFLTHDALRQADRIAVWLDNCSYQNKNYLLFQVVRAAVIHRHRLFTWITMFPCFEFGSYRFMGTLLVRVLYIFGKHWGMRSGQPCWFGFVTPSHHGTCSDWLIRIVFWIGGRIFSASSP